MKIHNSKSPIFDWQQPKALLQACPVYQPSPIVSTRYNTQNLLLKDETKRMGLGAFKALGGVYAVAKLIINQLGHDIDGNDLISPALKQLASKMTFVCASAGNHGLAVAAGAQLFGATARIYLAQTVPKAFAQRLKARGAEVVYAGANYEQSVAAAIADANQTSAIHLADGSWPGYIATPRLVMEGYTVMAEEMRTSFTLSEQWPSHVFLQAGVGGLAAAIAFMIRQNWPVQPKIIVVEPDSAACLALSVKLGRVAEVQGPVSNMGRLDCKTASLLAFEILAETADQFVSISDQQASDAVTVAKQLGFNTTPSGAAGLAAILATNKGYARPLAIITEADFSSLDCSSSSCASTS